MIKILFDFYEKEYQLSTNSISVTESSERSVEQNVVSGISAKISNGNHFQNKDCTSRDNFLKSPDRENMHWRADTTECSSIEINTIKVSTDNEIVDKRINQSIDDSICSLLNGYMGSKYTSISDCLTAVNDTTSGYLSYGCDVNVITNEKDILCLEISDKLWVGGAHDTWFRSIYCNFNLLTGIVLKLNDIVNDKYFEQLNSIAKKLFWKKYSEKVSLGEYTKTKFKLTEASFQIKNEGLLFQFHEGHFSCNADGALNILVPFKDIKELINPSFTFQ
jgi:hypothetical protein